MKLLPAILGVTLLGAFTGCTTTNNPLTPAAPARAGSTADSERRVYQFHHRTLPAFVFKSGGSFTADLFAGRYQNFLGAAAENVGEAYARAITFTALPELSAVVISFPEPATPPHCYHAAVITLGGETRYLTLERTHTFPGFPAKTFVGEWTAQGAHRNHGPRTHTDLAGFIADLRAFAAEAATQATPPTPPPPASSAPKPNA